jgi:hypothetical protein
MFEFNTKELVEILEYGVINNIKIIKQYFYTFLIEKDNVLYHNLCYLDLNDRICSYSISSGNYNLSQKTRKYIKNDKKWIYIKDYIIEDVLRNENKNLLKKSNINLKVYLLISNSDKCFRICNRITENISLKKYDDRKRNRGKKIESYTPNELMCIFKYLLSKTNHISILNILNKFNININNIKYKPFIQEIIKYILFTNKMYLIH